MGAARLGRASRKRPTRSRASPFRRAGAPWPSREQPWRRGSWPYPVRQPGPAAGPERGPDLVQEAQQLAVGLEHRALVVGDTTLPAELADDGVSLADAVPGHGREEVVLD